MNEEAIAALSELLNVMQVGEQALERAKSLYVDWDELYNTDHGDEEWIAWPLFPAKRQAVVYAPAKAGKSLIVLDVAASVAAGKPILGQDNKAGRRHVLYLDYEMTGADLLDRLSNMGYEPEDLTHLHYALLPIIPALNTPEGAKVVREMAAEVDAELVVVDTLSRAIDGDINGPQAVTDFYKWTGIALKADGRALVRLDHEGKDAAKGMIGSSMKSTDVDVVWHLKRTDNGLKMTRKWTRINWGEAEVDVAIKEEPLRHEIGPRGWDAGTPAVVKILDELGLPDNCSVRAAGVALRARGETASSAALKDACRRRRERAGLDAFVNQFSERGTPRGTPLYPQGTARLAERLDEHAVNRSERLAERLGTPQPSGVPSDRFSRKRDAEQDQPEDPWDPFGEDF